MDCHVQYRRGGTDYLVMFPSPESAVENACRLIDEGHDVFGIFTGDLTELDQTGTDRPDLRLVDESEISVRRASLGCKVSDAAIALMRDESERLCGDIILRLAKASSER